MSKNDDKKKNDEQWNKARGRRDGSDPKPKEPQRERNIGHKKGEEHSRTPKGNRG